MRIETLVVLVLLFSLLAFLSTSAAAGPVEPENPAVSVVFNVQLTADAPSEWRVLLFPEPTPEAEDDAAETTESTLSPVGDRPLDRGEAALLARVSDVAAGNGSIASGVAGASGLVQFSVPVGSYRVVAIRLRALDSACGERQDLPLVLERTPRGLLIINRLTDAAGAPVDRETHRQQLVVSAVALVDGRALPPSVLIDLPSATCASTSVASGEPPTTEAMCVPTCREGYLCVRGQCVSPCNPPCGPGETCDGSGRCVVPPEPPQPPGYRTHDGFYLRTGVGFAIGSGSVSDDVGNDASFTGFGPALVIAIGGSPMPGLAVGLSWGLSGILDNRLSGSVGSSEFDGFTVGPVTQGLLGVFVDYYPNPQKGLHFEGTFGLGPLTWQEGDPESIGFSTVTLPGADYDGTGIGFALGAGWEWFVGAEWSLGMLLRVQYTSGTLSTDDPELVNEIDLGVATTQMMFGATLH